ncbi:hypothetical protein fugu_001632 [Takifugu bimaculatus]|uniref:Lipoxygenase domain-containing protein n=1 Tax=Takifugu bimaculatus TaxID=433685 RepID=A0A4Z2BPH1_9TELE|nr:hypothetical protein fugu_001632 [Takifugu bimaculatus]
METYTVTVATGTSEYSGTNNYIFVTLLGEHGESERTLLDNPGLDFCRGAVDKYKVISPCPLGSIFMVRLEKQKYWVEDNWFCRYVKVEPPGGRSELTFPCYRWLIGDVKVEIREGTAKILYNDNNLLQAHRKEELKERQKKYRWASWTPGIPRCIDAETEADLHPDVRFDNEKKSDFQYSLQYALLELCLKKFAMMFGKSWNNLEDFKCLFWNLRSPIAGLPSKLCSREELCTLLSVAIFTASVQHAATNNGQFDWCAWIPNTPCTMRQPPPGDKDAVTMETIMATLPDISQSCMQMAITWHLGRPQPDAVPLGHYSEEYFTETKTLELIDKFKEELREIEEHILQQNEGTEPSYLFLLPSRIENSITI